MFYRYGVGYVAVRPAGGREPFDFSKTWKLGAAARRLPGSTGLNSQRVHLHMRAVAGPSGISYHQHGKAYANCTCGPTDTAAILLGLCKASEQVPEAMKPFKMLQHNLGPFPLLQRSLFLSFLFLQVVPYSCSLWHFALS